MSQVCAQTIFGLQHNATRMLTLRPAAVFG